MALEIFNKAHKKFAKLYYLCAAVVLIACLLSSSFALNLPWQLQDATGWVLMPGLFLDVLITHNVHKSRILDFFLIPLLSWVFWSFVLYFFIECYLRIFKRNS